MSVGLDTRYGRRSESQRDAPSLPPRPLGRPAGNERDEMSRRAAPTDLHVEELRARSSGLVTVLQLENPRAGPA